MVETRDKEQQFIEMLDTYKSVIAKVCYVYSSPDADFEDLYQETVINLWNGFDKFRGESKISTWIYRAAINTCITWVRRNKKHGSRITLQNDMPIAEEESTRIEDFKYLQSLIAQLLPLEKAIVTLWLDEKSYDEIAAITGLSKANVAVKLHRIKEKLSKMTDCHD